MRRIPNGKPRTYLGSRSAKPGSREGKAPIPTEQELKEWETKAGELQVRGFLLAEPVLVLVQAVRMLKRELVQTHSRLGRLAASQSPPAATKTQQAKE